MLDQPVASIGRDRRRFSAMPWDLELVPGMPMPSSEAQVRAAQRILDAHPELTLGEALAILAIALEALGVIGADA